MTLKLRLPKVHVRPRWESTTIRTLGILEIVFGLLLLVPAALAFYLGEQPRIFLEPVPFLLILGTACPYAAVARSSNMILSVGTPTLLSWM